MGLPLFVIPTSPRPVTQVVDEAAARARSNIRRERQERILRESRQDRRTRLNRDLTSLGTLSAQAEETLRSRVDLMDRVTRPEVNGRDTASSDGRPSAYTQSRSFDFLEDDFRIRSPESAEPPMPAEHRLDGDSQSSMPNRVMGLSSRDIIRESSLPNVPESHLRHAFHLSQSRVERSPRLVGTSGRYLISRSSSENVRRSRVSPSAPARRTFGEHAPLQSARPLPTLTPNFSPARQYSTEDAEFAGSGSLAALVAASSDAIDQQAGRESDTRYGSEMDTRNVQNSHETLITARQRLAGARRRRRQLLDGLGDRDRSLSPEGDGTWETLLTTIPPDPQAPSAGSSFASASAATSDSSRESAASNTTRTTPFSQEVAGSGPDTACDHDERPDDLLLDPWDSSSDDEEGPHAPTELLLSHVREHMIREARAEQEDSLMGMQRIVRRLAAREDIPDEWWAEVGFSRNVPRTAPEGVRGPTRRLRVI